jgi:hypothetical protein
MHQSRHEYGDAVTDGPYQPHRPSAYPEIPRRAVIGGAALLTLIFVSVAVMADRVAAARVEARTAEAFQEGMETPVPPAVHVRGFPVLTQLVTGALRHVDITAHDIPAQGADRPLPVTGLTLRLDDVRKSGDDGEAYACSAEAIADLSYTDVSHALGLEISPSTRPGQVNAAVLLPLGNEVTVTTSVSAASGNRIAFKTSTSQAARCRPPGENCSTRPSKSRSSCGTSPQA